MKVLTRTHSGVLVGAVFGLVGLTVAMLETHPRGGRMGIALLIVGAATVEVTVLYERTRGWDDLYRMGVDVGYGHGYEDGRRIARPVVVSLSDESVGDEGESRAAR